MVVGVIELALGVGVNIQKGQMQTIVKEYEKYHMYYGNGEDVIQSNYMDRVNRYYDLVTSFYEYGWGESFHFSHRWKGKSFQESIKHHEHFLALHICLNPRMKVLDVGCGIGDPLRELVRFSRTLITGLNNKFLPNNKRKRA